MTLARVAAGERGAGHAPRSASGHPERPPGSSRPTARTGSGRRSGRPRPWLYLTPLTVALAGWVYGPLLFTGVLSFMSWDLTSPHPSWLGMRNYARLVDQPEFPHAAWNTLVYAVVLLPFATLVPMVLAIALWKRPGPVSTAYRTVLFLPVVLAPVATAVAWQFLLDPLQGLVNAMIGWFGFGPRNWLGDPSTALPAIALITAVKVIGLNLLLFGAALANLDRRLLEAAALDGATRWEMTRHLVLPHLRRTVALLGLLSLVVTWPWIFANVAVLTQGGPSGATDNVYYRLFTYAFTFFDAGTASAAAVVITVALALVLGVGLLLAGWRRRAVA